MILRRFPHKLFRWISLPSFGYSRMFSLTISVSPDKDACSPLHCGSHSKCRSHTTRTTRTLSMLSLLFRCQNSVFPCAWSHIDERAHVIIIRRRHPPDWICYSCQLCCKRSITLSLFEVSHSSLSPTPHPSMLGHCLVHHFLLAHPRIPVSPNPFTIRSTAPIAIAIFPLSTIASPIPLGVGDRHKALHLV